MKEILLWEIYSAICENLIIHLIYIEFYIMKFSFQINNEDKLFWNIIYSIIFDVSFNEIKE